MKKFFDEFKSFIAKGNVLDMAVAVVIGGAFGKIVTSLVNDIIMPLTGLLTGGMSVADYKWVISEATTLNYGNFIQCIIDFLIISFCIFIVLKVVLGVKSKFEKKQEEEEAVEEAKTESAEEILAEIRDLIKNK